MTNQMTIQEYLNSKNIDYKERGEQLWTKCLFNACDDDSRPNEYHLSFNRETGQYFCQKCNAKGNLITLMQQLGDDVQPDKAVKAPASSKLDSLAANCHLQLNIELRGYLTHERGLDDETIDDLQLGYGDFYERRWITIPVRDANGVTALKLRKLPWDDNNPDKYMWYPKHTATLFNGHTLLREQPEDVLICEGEFDAIMALRQGLHTAVSSTAGAATFKEEWLSYFEHAKTVWICYDNDEQGQAGAKRVAELFEKRRPDIQVMNIKLPQELGEKADLTDYFLQPEADPGKLFEDYAEQVAGEPPIDPSEFVEMNIDDLAAVLDQTIRFDKENKCIMFLGYLTAYTEADQLNLFVNGPSSSGKTYLVTEIAKYFPVEDVEEYASASPTSFIHRYPKQDPETGVFYVDCERKILLFLELPHHKLQANLRPFLSHDKKEIIFLMTDKNKRGGNRTKESRLRGFSATAFCSVSMRMDDQEATRAILLSPEVSEAKMNEGIALTMARTADPVKYKQMIEANPNRRSLKRRIRAIKQLHVDSVIIPNPDSVLGIFKKITGKPKPRHQRDIAHLSSLIKAVSLLNAWWRLDDQNNVVATAGDVEQAVLLWKGISASQELGIPPYAYNFYKTFIVPVFEEKNNGRQPEFVEATGAIGVTRQEIRAKHFQLTGQMMNEDILRKNILPTLEAASLIVQEKDPANGKQMLIYPKYDRDEHSGDDTVASDHEPIIDPFDH